MIKNEGKFFITCIVKKGLISYCYRKPTLANQMKKDRKLNGGCIFSSHGTTQSAGVTILFKHRTPCKVQFISQDLQGRFVILKIEGNRQQYQLFNVYGPNADDAEFFHRLFYEMDALEVDLNILGGDFNLVLVKYIDKQGGLPFTHETACKTLLEYCEGNDLVDSWRIFNEGVQKLTWKRLQPAPIFVCLDFILVSNFIHQMVNKVDIWPGFKTNHALPVITLCYWMGLGVWVIGSYTVNYLMIQNLLNRQVRS